jgi:hypothetical protein
MKFLVFFGQSKSSFPSLNFVFFLDSLSSESSFSDEPLDLRGFGSRGGIGVLFAFEGSSNCVLFDECARA